MKATALTDTEMLRWRSFRFMVENTGLLVSRDLARKTGATGPEFSVLVLLSEAPNHELRQQELAEKMRWDRTRLAHQVKRSEIRGLLTKRKLAGASLVKLTEKAELLLRDSIPAHAKAVRKHFFSRLSENQLSVLQDVADVLDHDDVV